MFQTSGQNYFKIAVSDIKMPSVALRYVRSGALLLLSTESHGAQQSTSFINNAVRASSHCHIYTIICLISLYRRLSVKSQPWISNMPPTPKLKTTLVYSNYRKRPSTPRSALP